MDIVIEEIKQILKETALARKDNEARVKETDARFKDLEARFKETDAMIRRTEKKISSIGEKFGYFTEGMALPTMEKILIKKFHIDTIMPRFTKKIPGGKFLEYDVFGYRNGIINNAVVVEIKSKLRREHITEMVSELFAFKTIFPEHASKHLYGIIAAVDVPSKSLITQVEESGLYFARIADDIFTLQENSHPLDFNL